MKTLTLWNPWAWCVCHGKDVENRNWSPLSYGLAPGPRSWFAIHASVRKPLKRDMAAARELAELALGVEASRALPWDDMPSGAVVAVARLAGICGQGECSSVWRTDTAYGWRLADVVALPTPVPCKGKQKLWSLYGDVLAEVAHQHGKALG